MRLLRFGRTGGALLKLVVFAAVTLVATGVLAATIGNLRFVDQEEYTAVFSDVTGVVKGDDVRVAGVRVGQVEGLKVLGRDRAALRFKVDASVPLRTSTRAVIRYRNLVGQRYLALVEGPGGGPLHNGDTIPLARTTPALDLTVLFNGFKPLFAALNPSDVNNLATEIITTLQGEGGTVTSLLAHTASLTSALADRDQLIGRVVDNLNTVLGTVDERDQQLSALIAEMQRFVSGLAADRTAIGTSLANIDALAGATAGLLAEGRPALRTDIASLGVVAGTLEDNQQVVERTLQRLPRKLNAVTRTATYGSWFNFYLCDFEGRVVLPTGAVLTPNYSVKAARCAG